METNAGQSDIDPRRPLLEALKGKIADRIVSLEQVPPSSSSSVDSAPSVPALLDIHALRLLGEQANGGVCSIAVNNIVSNLTEVSATNWHKIVTEVYDHTAQDFLPVMATKSVGRTIFGAPRYKEVQTTGEFSAVGSPVKLASGVTVSMGFCNDNFGVVTREGSFVPMISFTDRRSSEVNCSYAQFIHTNLPFGQDLVVTRADHEIVVGVQEERGLVVTKKVLDEINRLQVATNKAEDPAGLDMSDIIAYLNVETVMANVFGLDPERNYNGEEILRQKIRKLITPHDGTEATQEPIVKDMRILEATHYEGEQGSATDYTVTTYISPNAATSNGVSSGRKAKAVPSSPQPVVIEQTIEFPNANNTKPEVVWRLSLGRRIGQAALHEAGLTTCGVDEIIEYIATRIPAQETQQKSLALHTTPALFKELTLVAGDEAIRQLFQGPLTHAQKLYEYIAPRQKLSFSRQQWLSIVEKYGQLRTNSKDYDETQVYLVPDLTFDKWTEVLGSLGVSFDINNSVSYIKQLLLPFPEFDRSYITDGNNIRWMMRRHIHNLNIDNTDGYEQSSLLASFLTVLVDKIIHGGVKDMSYALIRTGGKNGATFEGIYDQNSHSLSFR